MWGKWCAIACLAALPAGEVSAAKIEAVATSPGDLKMLPLSIGGRVATVGSAASGPAYVRQWPGTYFQTAFVGKDAFFRVGPGDVSLRVSVDGGAPMPLSKPAPGLYHVAQIAPGRHLLRVDVASESQAGPTSFGGFYAPRATKALPIQAPARQIEFIGDSHTVGYANMSSRRGCSDDEIWATTDTSQGVAPSTARHYRAAYQVNAISGRGIVRNYNGFSADTMPQAYPYVLFDKATRYDDVSWKPQLIVIALGTNDFTTPLNPGEKWKTRDALHEDFEASYAGFVRALRARNPNAYFLLWATDMAGGEIATEVTRVVERLQAAGEQRVAFVPVGGLNLSACNYHPSAADDRTIAAALSRFVDAHPQIWHGR